MALKAGTQLLSVEYHECPVFSARPRLPAPTGHGSLRAFLFGERMNDVRSQIDLQAVARQVMLEHGFDPDFPPQVQQQLASLKSHPSVAAPSTVIRDLRGLLWSSIDNDTSRDLDQLEVAELLPNGDAKVLVA